MYPQRAFENRRCRLSCSTHCSDPRFQDLLIFFMLEKILGYSFQHVSYFSKWLDFENCWVGSVGCSECYKSDHSSRYLNLNSGTYLSAPMFEHLGPSVCDSGMVFYTTESYAWWEFYDAEDTKCWRREVCLQKGRKITGASIFKYFYEDSYLIWLDSEL